MRVELEEAFRWSKPGSGEGVDHPLFLIAAPTGDSEPFGDDLVDRLAGVERAGWILEHHLHSRIVEDRLDGSPAAAVEGCALEADRPRGRGLESLDRSDQGCLPRPRLTDQGHDLAGENLE